MTCMDSLGPPRIEGDGWISLPGPDGTGSVHARIASRIDGRVIITDLYVHGDDITTATMRALPLGRIEAFANAVATGSDVPFETSDLVVESVPLLVSVGVHSDSDVSMSELRSRVEGGEARSADARKRKRRPPLTRPDGSDPDVFYQRVAAAYGELVLTTSKPAKLLAEEADVPVPTVHRWVREARRRGFLPKARKGRAG